MHVPIFCGAHLGRGHRLPRRSAVDPREPTVAKDGRRHRRRRDAAAHHQVSVLSADAGRDRRKPSPTSSTKRRSWPSSHFTAWRHPFSPEMRRERSDRARDVLPRQRDDERAARSDDDLHRSRSPVSGAAAAISGCGLITFARGWVTERRRRQDAGHQYRRAHHLLRSRGRVVHAAVRPDRHGWIDERLLGLSDFELARRVLQRRAASRADGVRPRRRSSPAAGVRRNPRADARARGCPQLLLAAVVPAGPAAGPSRRRRPPSVGQPAAKLSAGARRAARAQPVRRRPRFRRCARMQSDVRRDRRLDGGVAHRSRPADGTHGRPHGAAAVRRQRSCVVVPGASRTGSSPVASIRGRSSSSSATPT